MEMTIQVFFEGFNFRFVEFENIGGVGFAIFV